MVGQPAKAEWPSMKKVNMLQAIFAWECDLILLLSGELFATMFLLM